MYFFPTDIETYVAVTKASIQSDAAEQWILSNPSQARALKEIITRAVCTRNKFNDGRVRAKIVIGNEVYFVDSEGVVQHHDENKAVNIDDLAKLRDSLLEGQIRPNPNRQAPLPNN